MFEHLSDDEILALDPVRNATGYSRPVVEVMEIHQRQGAIRSRQAQTVAAASRVVALGAETPAAPGRHDVRDLVTGTQVVNIPMTSVSQEQGETVYQGLMQASQRAASGQTCDLRAIVDICHRTGPFPGFRDLFAVDELARLGAADPLLTDRVYRQFVRLCLADNVREIIVTTDALLEREIAPIVDRIPTPETRESIAEAMRLWKENARNPWRNFYHRTDRVARPGENIGREYCLPLHAEDPSYFSVGKMDDGNAPDHAGAGYEPFMRALLLRVPPDGHNTFLEALDALHELTHVDQHNRFLRKHGRGDRTRTAAAHAAYTRPMEGGADRVAYGILEEEAEAFANMIELIIARTGFGNLRVDTVMRTLGMNPADERRGRQIYRILSLAIPYYTGGKRRGEVFPAGYLEAIEQFYRQSGVRVIRSAELVMPEGD